MPENPWLQIPTLTGERALLRGYQDQDLDALMEIVTDPDVNRLTGSVHSTAGAASATADREQLQQWYSTRAEQSGRLDLMIVDRDGPGGPDSPCVGEVVLNQWDEENESCNIRILIGPAGRDRGLGSESMRLMVDHAFTHLPLHRIALGVFTFNPRAQRVYEKAGFVVEGRERDALRFDAGWVDQVMMSLLRPEWQAAR
ncbi:GNAT family N-acetyltransferase [Ruania halotolerans]|uniref:GNAT family N-acetyltransferase n=1 Tax=Ruania halotolerans TaxID=2897773 RepID=UPI001E548802|nr:GNAT family protein [Ruania halotolerans]UFU05026.1 GNAT family N-acetyltransferase [Ruania halotolerans]